MYFIVHIIKILSKTKGLNKTQIWVSFQISK